MHNKDELDSVEDIAEAAREAIERLDALSAGASVSIEKKVAPLRRKLLHRFPTLSLLAVAFGVIATSLGVELLIMRYEIFTEHPLILILIGVSTLVLTGTLYKKLG